MKRLNAVWEYSLRRLILFILIFGWLWGQQPPENLHFVVSRLGNTSNPLIRGRQLQYTQYRDKLILLEKRIMENPELFFGGKQSGLLQNRLDLVQSFLEKRDGPLQIITWSPKEEEPLPRREQKKSGERITYYYFKASL